MGDSRQHFKGSFIGDARSTPTLRGQAVDYNALPPDDQKAIDEIKAGTRHPADGSLRVREHVRRYLGDVEPA